MVDRLAMLENLASAKPDDPFLRYGLAMELRKQGESQRARDVFAQLVTDHPDYVATYLMYGNLLVELGDKAAAARIYERGVEAANEAGNEHAAGELAAARAELP